MKNKTIKRYIGMFHVLSPITEPNHFHDNVEKAIAECQKDNQIVEVQYQQSDNGLSALVLGYKNVEVPNDN